MKLTLWYYSAFRYSLSNWFWTQGCTLFAFAHLPESTAQRSFAWHVFTFHSGCWFDSLPSYTNTYCVFLWAADHRWGAHHNLPGLSPPAVSVCVRLWQHHRCHLACSGTELPPPQVTSHTYTSNFVLSFARNCKIFNWFYIKIFVSRVFILAAWCSGDCSYAFKFQKRKTWILILSLKIAGLR